jgi:hypothetical protein
LVPALTVLACAIIFTALAPRRDRRVPGVEHPGRARVHRALDAVPARIAPLARAHRGPACANASPNRLWNYTTGIELGIGATLSWWPYIGAMIRMAPNGRTIVLPVMLGMAAPVPLLSLIGLAGALVLKSSDPTEWLRIVGGPAYASSP